MTLYNEHDPFAAGDEELNLANAEIIVCVVNAMAGIQDPAKFVEAVKELQVMARRMAQLPGTRFRKAIDKLDEAMGVKR